MALKLSNRTPEASVLNHCPTPSSQTLHIQRHHAPGQTASVHLRSTHVLKYPALAESRALTALHGEADAQVLAGLQGSGTWGWKGAQLSRRQR